MITNYFQNSNTTQEEILNTSAMLHIKGGTDDKRAARPVKAVTKTKTDCKKS